MNRNDLSLNWYVARRHFRAPGKLVIGVAPLFMGWWRVALYRNGTPLLATWAMQSVMELDELPPVGTQPSGLPAPAIWARAGNIDLLYLGDSSRPSTGDVDRLAEDVRATLSWLDLAKTIVAGWRMASDLTTYFCCYEAGRLRAPRHALELTGGLPRSLLDADRRDEHFGTDWFTDEAGLEVKLEWRSARVGDATWFMIRVPELASG